ncbi:MAG: magnesium transporter [Gammaproteobacteria bacterium]
MIELEPRDQEAQEKQLEDTCIVAAWLAESGNPTALSAHLEKMSREELVRLLNAVFDERRLRIWEALPEELRQELKVGLEFDPEMVAAEAPPPAQPLADRFHQAIKEDNIDSLAEVIEPLEEPELAEALAALPSHERKLIWGAILPEQKSRVLPWMDEGVRESLLAGMTEEDLIPMAGGMDHDDLIEVVEAVKDDVADAILRSLSGDERESMEMRLAYPEDSAGRLMETEWVAVRADVTLSVVARYLKRRGNLPSHTDGLMVVDREGRYQGKLPVSAVLTKDDSLTVAETMEPNVDWIRADADQADVADLFERRDVTSVPVVDDEHRLIGRITLDDALDVIREEAEAPLLHMAGLEDGEDLFAPIGTSARRRMFWLGLNLITAFLAAYVIGMFEATLDQVVALAVLMPIVASMGGIAGSQTLTLAIRGLAMGQISTANTRWLAFKEIVIGGMNGAVWAVVVGALAWVWFGNPMIALVIGCAMIINQLAAAAAGLAVPLVLDRWGIDPALSGSVILTTVTDVVGFMSFLGLATVVLL